MKKRVESVKNDAPAPMASPGFEVSMWPIEKPIDYPKNARKWTQQAVDKVATSIREFGWRQPVLVDSQGVIVIGHLRRLAGKSIGLTECPVHVARDLSPEKIRALRLADNRTGQEAPWGMGLLAAEFLDLKTDFDIDLSFTAFDSREIDALLLAPNPVEDDVPPVPEVPTSRRGDLWVMGGHRLLCGDATKVEDVRRLLGLVAPLLMVTDPPYGVSYSPKWRVEAGVNPNHAKLGEVPNDDRVDWREAYALFQGDLAYVWHAGRHAAAVQQSIEACGFEIRNQIIWAKDRFALSRGDYHWQHEPCWYSV